MPFEEMLDEFRLLGGYDDSFDVIAHANRQHSSIRSR